MGQEEFNYIPTGFNASASVNRNYGLMKAFETINEYIIMIDDDIGGFYTGWQHDLVEPLKTDVTGKWEREGRDYLNKAVTKKLSRFVKIQKI